VEAYRKVKMASVVLSYSTTQQNMGNPSKASGAQLADIKINIKIFMPIASPATAPKSLLVFINAHKKFHKHTDTVITFTQSIPKYRIYQQGSNG
jgi:hypothetical protein